MGAYEDVCSQEGEFDFMSGIGKDIENMIEESIGEDFSDVHDIIAEEKRNQNYKDFLMFLKTYKVIPLFQRVVHSGKAPVIPEKQFLIGFKPIDGLCFLASKPQHKKILCDEKILRVSMICPFVHSLQYILLEFDEYRIWSYFPKKCTDICPLGAGDGYLRNFLFER